MTGSDEAAPVRARIESAMGSREGKHHKATLFRSAHLLLGVNSLDPGQEQPVHTHAGQDKFYLVVEGEGDFTVGAHRFRGAVGEVVWAAEGVPHGVRNEGPGRLSLLVGIAPAP